MKSIFFIVVTSLFFLACKKKVNTLDTPIEEISCTCTTSKFDTFDWNAPMCNGFLHTFNYIDYRADNTTLQYSNVEAYFNNKPDIQMNGNFVEVNSVLLNGDSVFVRLDANLKPYIYRNFYQVNKSDLKWAINGAQGIPSFTYTSNLKEPSADLSGLPKVITKSKLKSFQVNLVENITYAVIILIDQSGNSHSNSSVSLHAGLNCVCFPEADIKLMGPGDASLVIILENANFQTFDSKNFKFFKTVQYSKAIKIFP